MTDIFDKLNPPQREAVLAAEGPVLILAGAGSGKTRVLTHRIAYLLEEKGVMPWNILAITFTNKAAEEMKTRVSAICPGGDSVFVATFHSTCVRILRTGADRLGYGRDFTIYDSDDQKTLMRQIIKQKDFDPKQYREKEILGRISSMKNDLIGPENFSRTVAGNFRESRIAELYQEYQKRLMGANAMDFDDLLLNAVQLFEDNPDILTQYRHRFRYIMVDEYQDTNNAQFKLIELLAREHHNICVVGDDDQSIYKFRGANIQNILNFETAFPGALVVRLEQNYRSTKNILAAANGVIANNEGRKEKTLWSDKPEGDKLALRQYDDAREEARSIARDIERNKTSFPYGSCAVLYRTNAQSRILEEAFVQLGLPYRLVGGTNFYQRKEIKDILCYLKTIANGQDDVAVQRIINVPRRGIGDTSVRKVAELASNWGISFYEALKMASSEPSLKRAGGKLREFTELIETLRREKNGMTVAELIEQILKATGYEEELQEEGEIEALARMENIREFQNKAVDFGDEPGDETALSRFLEDVALVAEVDSLAEGEERVVLMTLHSAKGLEFPKVYMAGMEDGLFPSNISLNSGDPEDLEEERRLCYVGITRAQEKLVLTAAKLRMVNGETQYHNLSRFVEEIPENVLVKEGSRLMETRSEMQRRQEKRGDYGDAAMFGGGSYGSYGRDSSEQRPRRSQEGSFGWQDFGDSFGFGYSSGSRKKPAARTTDPSLMSYFAQTAPKPKGEVKTELKPGDRVNQKRFGLGTVVEVKPGKKDTEVTVDFDKAGRKIMLASFANFTSAEE